MKCTSYMQAWFSHFRHVCMQHIEYAWMRLFVYARMYTAGFAWVMLLAATRRALLVSRGLRPGRLHALRSRVLGIFRDEEGS